MAIYEYCCERGGLFEVFRPMGTAPESVACSACGSPARRVFSAPMLVTGARSAWTAAVDRAEKSRHEPEIVSSLPSSGAGRRVSTVQMTPALRGLPRP